MGIYPISYLLNYLSIDSIIIAIIGMQAIASIVPKSGIN
jgi:hypothetical protein